MSPHHTRSPRRTATHIWYIYKCNIARIRTSQPRACNNRTVRRARPQCSCLVPRTSKRCGAITVSSSSVHGPTRGRSCTAVDSENSSRDGDFHFLAYIFTFLRILAIYSSGTDGSSFKSVDLTKSSKHPFMLCKRSVYMCIRTLSR